MTSRLGFFAAAAILATPPVDTGVFPGTVFQSNLEGANDTQPTEGLDDSPFDHEVEYTGGNCQIGTAVAKFGSSSLYNLGSGGSMRVIPQGDEFAFGAGDFCIEMFVMRDGTTSDDFIASMWDFNSNQRGWAIYTSGTSGWAFSLSTDGTSSGAQRFGGAMTGLPQDTSWHHIVVCRVGTTLSAYADGTRVGTETNSSTIFDTTAYPTFTDIFDGFNEFDGKVDGIRMVKGGSPYDPTQPTITVPTSYEDYEYTEPVEDDGTRRHWRVRVTGVESGSRVQIRELRFKGSFSDTAYMTGGTASASTEDGVNVAARAFDGDDDTGLTDNFWRAASGDMDDGDAWLAYDFGDGNERRCHGIIITTTADSSSLDPTSLVVESSPDGSVWTEEWTQLTPNCYGTKVYMNPNLHDDVAVNGDFETGDKTGWTDGTGGSVMTVETASSGSDAPFEGTYLLDTGGAATDPEIYQDIDLTAYLETADIDAGIGKCIAHLEGINWSTDADEARIKLSWLDVSDAVIGTPTEVGTSAQDWRQVVNSFAGETIPSGARTLRLACKSHLATGGTANVAHDLVRCFFATEGVAVEAVNHYVVAKLQEGNFIQTVSHYVIAEDVS